MNERSALDLARRLRVELSDHADNAEAVRANPNAAPGDGWAVAVYLPDGSASHVIGGERSGYSRTDRTDGWVSWERLLDSFRPPAVEETSPDDDADLVALLTDAIVRASDVMRDLRAIRDELVLRSKR